VKFLNRFGRLPLERKFLILFIAICIALPFVVVRSPADIFTYSLPLWVSFHGTVGLFWVTDGKPLGLAFIACYGISSVEMLGIYFGTFGIRFLFEKAVNWLKKQLEKGLRIPFSENQLLLIKNGAGYKKLNSFAESKKKKFIEWLGKKSIWVTVVLLLLPLPITDILAAVALGQRRLKYGHWYLLAINLPHILSVVLLIYLGIDFFFL